MSRLFVILILALLAAGCATGARPTAKQSLEFSMKQEYPRGEAIPVTIENHSKVSYVFNPDYPACYNLKFKDESGKLHKIKRPAPDGLKTLKDGEFVVPEGTHCDLVSDALIRPGEKKTLVKWLQKECLEDEFGCRKSEPVAPGKYTIIGSFQEATGEAGGTLVKGAKTRIRSTFTIK